MTKFDQILKSNIFIKKINNCGNKQYEITILEKNNFLLYQVFNYNSIPDNKNRIIQNVSQKSWLKSFKQLQFFYNFAPTTIMEIENKLYAFIINNVVIKDDIMIFTVATQSFSGTIDNMASDVSTDIPCGKFNSVRFDIDFSVDV